MKQRLLTLLFIAQLIPLGGGLHWPLMIRLKSMV